MLPVVMAGKYHIDDMQKDGRTFHVASYAYSNKRASEHLDALAVDAPGNPELSEELASAYQKLADVQGNPGAANLGDTAGARVSQRKALALRQSLAAARRTSTVRIAWPRRSSTRPIPSPIRRRRSTSPSRRGPLPTDSRSFVPVT